MPDSINALNADLFAGESKDAPLSSPRKKAMDFLARREYGHAELVGRLVAAGFADGVAADTVAVLAAEGLQDDTRFAASYIAARVGRGSGPLRIATALRERGLSSSVVESALAAADVDWYVQARAARSKKYGLEPVKDYAEKARQMRFLQYRGFDFEHIRAAMDECD